MADTQPFLAALQLSDSALPVGRFVHSYGLESWLASHEGDVTDALAELAAAYVREAVAPLDGAVVAHAHRATSMAELHALDRLLTAHRLSPPAREASTSCGRRLAALSVELTEAPLVRELAGCVQRRETAGNVPVVAGALDAALGLSTAEAVAVELRGVVAGLFSAAVRLGRLAPTRAQALLARLAPVLAEATEEALTLGRDELRSTAPELEIAALAHRRRDGRMFAT